MASIQILGGTAHKIPVDFKKALIANAKAKETWDNITPLARNEFICWVITVKQQKTRDEHIKRAIEDLTRGKRRPCCWMGCIHRADKPLNPSQKWILKKQNSSK